MKKILFAFIISFSAVSFTQAQEIIKGVKNSDFLLKGSRKMTQVKLKDGSALLIQNNEGQMIFKLIKNGKETEMLKPSPDYIYGQVSEFDIDGDGKPEMLIAYRSAPAAFEVHIYKKAEFEVDYKLFTTINGQDHCEFPGDNTVKIYAEDLTMSHLKFKADGSWIVLQQ